MRDLVWAFKNKMFAFLLKAAPGPRTNSRIMQLFLSTVFCENFTGWQYCCANFVKHLIVIPQNFCPRILDLKFELSQKFMRDLVWAFKNKMFPFLLKAAPGPRTNSRINAVISLYSVLREFYGVTILLCQFCQALQCHPAKFLSTDFRLEVWTFTKIYAGSGMGI